ncbi:hypothetical protein SRABI133_01668 [Peribacillus simplex]|uniref:Uncharacterized protein n=1 Tax=Peribacillus simplex TaxID=1478 RepID=A0A9W4KZ33_9BACI|nr:hypothetical protein SRABI133_01668 [Peribacillus simplex]
MSQKSSQTTIAVNFPITFYDKSENLTDELGKVKLKAVKK